MKYESHSAVLPWAKWTAVAAYLVALAAAYSLFFFAEPLTDDYCTASYRVTLTAFLQERYANWSGRWFGLGVERFVLSTVDFIRFYPLLPLAVSLGLTASIYVFIRSFFRQRLPQRLVVVLTAAFFILYWNLHPSPGQSFYWFTGSVEYQLNFVLSLALIAVVISAPVQGERWPWVRTVCACLLAFLAIGTHELFGLMLCAVLAAGAITTHYLDHPHRRLWAFATGAAVLSLAFVLAAPGYTMRSATFPGGHDIERALRVAAPEAVNAGLRWISSRTLLTATVLFVIHPQIRELNPEWIRRLPAWWKYLPLTLWLGILAAGFFAPAYATGREIAGRVVGGIHLIFLLGWFFLVFVFTRHSTLLSIFSNIKDRHLRVLASWTLVLFSISVAATGNTRTAVFDLAYRARSWHSALHDRYESLRTAQRNDLPELIVPEPPPRPSMFYQGGTDITTDAADWKNQCVADYFGVPAVRMASDRGSSETAGEQ